VDGHRIFWIGLETALLPGQRLASKRVGLDGGTEMRNEEIKQAVRGRYGKFAEGGGRREDC